MRTADLPRPAADRPTVDWRDAHRDAARLVATEHATLATARRLRTPVGVALIVLAAAGLVATLWGLGVPPHEDPAGTVVWGVILTVRAAVAVGLVYVLARVVQWTVAPSRLRAGLTDALADATTLAGPETAARLSARFATPRRWWSPAETRRAAESLEAVTAEVDQLSEQA